MIIIGGHPRSHDPRSGGPLSWPGLRYAGIPDGPGTHSVIDLDAPLDERTIASDLDLADTIDAMRALALWDEALAGL